MHNIILRVYYDEYLKSREFVMSELVIELSSAVHVAI